jgi:cytochrome c-type biogenesis protein CcmH/NrfG
VRLTSGDAEGAVEAWTQALKHAGPDEPAVRAEATTLLTQAGKADDAKRFSP